MLNLDVIKSMPPLECLNGLFVCNLLFKQISFLYIQTLHNDCSHFEDVHRRRRSRAEFGLVDQENEGQQKEGGALLQEIIQSIMQLQKEIKLIGTDDYDRQISKKEMKTLGIHQKLKEKRKLKLQMTQGRTKTT